MGHSVGYHPQEDGGLFGGLVGASSGCDKEAEEHEEEADRDGLVSALAATRWWCNGAAVICVGATISTADDLFVAFGVGCL